MEIAIIADSSQKQKMEEWLLKNKELLKKFTIFSGELNKQSIEKLVHQFYKKEIKYCIYFIDAIIGNFYLVRIAVASGTIIGLNEDSANFIIGAISET